MLPHAAQLIFVGWIGIGLLLIGLGTLFRALCDAPALLASRGRGM